MERETVTTIKLSKAELEELIRKAMHLDEHTRFQFKFTEEGPQYDSYTVLTGVEIRTKP